MMVIKFGFFVNQGPQGPTGIAGPQGERGERVSCNGVIDRVFVVLRPIDFISVYDMMVSGSVSDIDLYFNIGRGWRIWNSRTPRAGWTNCESLYSFITIYTI